MGEIKLKESLRYERKQGKVHPQILEKIGREAASDMREIGQRTV